MFLRLAAGRYRTLNWIINKLLSRVAQLNVRSFYLSLSFATQYFFLFFSHLASSLRLGWKMIRRRCELGWDKVESEDSEGFSLNDNYTLLQRLEIFFFGPVQWLEKCLRKIFIRHTFPHTHILGNLSSLFIHGFFLRFFWFFFSFIFLFSSLQRRSSTFKPQWVIYLFS